MTYKIVDKNRKYDVFNSIKFKSTAELILTGYQAALQYYSNMEDSHIAETVIIEEEK